MSDKNIRKFLHHNPNVICDTCGRKRKWSEVIHSYGTGDIPVIISCIDGCADYRHPLNDPPPVIFDGQPWPDARPEATDTFIAVNTAPVSWNNNTYEYGANPAPFSFDPPVNDNVNWEST